MCHKVFCQQKILHIISLRLNPLPHNIIYSYYISMFFEILPGYSRLYAFQLILFYNRCTAAQAAVTKPTQCMHLQKTQITENYPIFLFYTFLIQLRNKKHTARRYYLSKIFINQIQIKESGIMFKCIFKNVFYCITCSIIVSVIFCFICLKGSNKTEVLQTPHSIASTDKTPGNKTVFKDVSLTKENKCNKNKYIDKKCL